MIPAVAWTWYVPSQVYSSFSISENHNYAELSGPLAQDSCNSKHKVHMAQMKINELPLVPLKRHLYVNLQGQTIGRTINDAA